MQRMLTILNQIFELEGINNFTREGDERMELLRVKEGCSCTFGKERSMNCGLPFQHNTQSVCLCSGGTAAV